MTEVNEMRRGMLVLSQAGSTVFRNNTGMGWVGQGGVSPVRHQTVVTLHPGDVVIRAARPLHAGLCEGSSDVIGWTPKFVTPDMVGHHVAIFTAIEAKVRGGKVTAPQKNFIVQVKAAGGYAGVAYEPDDYLRITGKLQ